MAKLRCGCGAIIISWKDAFTHFTPGSSVSKWKAIWLLLTMRIVTEKSYRRP